MKTEQPVPRIAQRTENVSLVGSGLFQSPYLTTKEASEYLRMSVSAILRLPDLPYLKGCPNRYSKQDLDDWFERNKWKAEIA